MTLRAVCDTLRRQQARLDRGMRDRARVPAKAARTLLTAMARHVRRALTDPGRERAGDTWDLADVRPRRGGCRSPASPSRGCAEAAKGWAGEELPRHRGAGASKVRAKVNALARLSESLRGRGDRGLGPAALGRTDIENFLNRLGYLESAGTISRYHRNVICRDARAVLAGIRALGLTRPGQPAAGLPGDFALGPATSPPNPHAANPAGTCRRRS